jgi:hypothetical protein
MLGRTGFLMLFMVCLALPPTAGADLVLRQPEFTITLPKGWTPVPTEIVAAFNESVGGMAPAATAPKFNYGFQLHPDDGGINYPYMLIQVSDAGRVSDDVLKEYEKINVAEAGKKIPGLKSWVDQTTFGKRQYDPVTHIIWLSTLAHLDNIGDVQGLSGTLLTQRGVVRAMCYALARNAEKEIPLCRKTILSIRVSPDRVYQSR